MYYQILIAFVIHHRKKQPKPVDLSEVLDFRAILDCLKRDGELPSGVTLLKEKFSCPVFSLENRPGISILLVI